MSDQNELRELIVQLANLWEHKLTPQKIAWYESSWHAIPRENLIGAIQEWNRTGKFMPKPSEIIERSGVSGTGNPCGDAWEVVLKAIRAVGAYESVCFTDPAITDAIDNMSGGWVGLCDTPIEKMAFKEKEFVSRYESSRRRKLPLRVLGGMFARDVRNQTPQTKVIGRDDEHRIRIEHYVPPQEQKLLPLSKPIPAEALAKKLEVKPCVPTNSVRDTQPASPTKNAKPPEMIAAEQALLRNKKLQALKKQLMAEDHIR